MCKSRNFVCKKHRPLNIPEKKVDFRNILDKEIISDQNKFAIFNYIFKISNFCKLSIC